MAEEGRLLDDGVERLGDGADLGDASRAGTGVAVATVAALYASARLRSGNALACGDGADLGGSTGDSGEGAAGLGAFEAPVGDERVVAGDLEVDVVFDGEGDGVLGGEVDGSGADEGLEAGGVIGADFGDCGGEVGADEDVVLGADGGDGGSLGVGEGEREGAG